MCVPVQMMGTTCGICTKDLEVFAWTDFLVIDELPCDYKNVHADTNTLLNILRVQNSTAAKMVVDSQELKMLKPMDDGVSTFRTVRSI